MAVLVDDKSIPQNTDLEAQCIDNNTINLELSDI